jgi:hypothetical protein
MDPNLRGGRAIHCEAELPRNLCHHLASSIDPAISWGWKTTVLQKMGDLKVLFGLRCYARVFPNMEFISSGGFQYKHGLVEHDLGYLIFKKPSYVYSMSLGILFDLWCGDFHESTKGGVVK